MERKRNLKLGESGKVSLIIYKLSELGEVSFGMLKLGELGEVSSGIYKSGVEILLWILIFGYF